MCTCRKTTRKLMINVGTSIQPILVTLYYNAYTENFHKFEKIYLCKIFLITTLGYINIYRITHKHLYSTIKNISQVLLTLVQNTSKLDE